MTTDSNTRWANANAQIRHLMICVRVKEEKIQVLEDELALLKAERQVEQRQVAKRLQALSEAIEDARLQRMNFKTGIEPQKPWYKRIFRKK
jgi:hypothetical protein